MIQFLFLVMAEAAIGEPAPAQTPPATEATSPAPAASDATASTAAAPAPAAAPQAQDRVRCRMVPVLGSRLGQRRCTTLRQDEAQATDAKREMDDLQRRALNNTPSGH